MVSFLEKLAGFGYVVNPTSLPRVRSGLSPPGTLLVLPWGVSSPLHFQEIIFFIA